MHEALIFNLPLKGSAKNECARNPGARKKRCAKFEIERKLSELRYFYLVYFILSGEYQFLAHYY